MRGTGNSGAYPEIGLVARLNNWSVARLVERSIARGEGQLASSGALVVETGAFTGRSPRDRFIVRDTVTEHRVAWGGLNHPLDPDSFDRVRRRMVRYAGGRDLHVQDGFAGVDPDHRLGVRVVTELAWQSLFARQLLIRPSPDELAAFQPDWTLVCLPGCRAVPAEDGTATETFILLNFERRLVLIGGTAYAGEIKKAVFSVMNFLMPPNGVLPMHCSANVGPHGDTALFFGLSGTGKTTLSADPERQLVGDDEHGWGGAGVFNFEGGCYAKCIHLTEAREPQIWRALRFGAVLENVVLDPVTRDPDFDDASRSENTRAAYALAFIEQRWTQPLARHPRTILFLTADAFGVLPPLAHLSLPQALYHFLSGYTAKLAGTEVGVKEPQATFSACFGEPFLPLPPSTYAKMLGDRLARNETRCWLVNTGWTAGGFGVGHRIDLAHTWAMVRAVLSGALDEVACTREPVFQLAVPESVPGVPKPLLNPRAHWPTGAAYDRAARILAARFRANFERFTSVPEEILAAAPKAA